MQTIHDSRHALATLDDAGIGTLQLRDAGKLNIVGTPAIGELRAALHTLAATPALRVLVLRGHSEHAFIGGADIGEMAQLTPATAKVFITGLAALCDAVMQVPVPVIARITGWCLGGGLEVALACDLRLCDDSAVFGMPEVKVGIPSVIHAALLPRLIGQARSDWLLLTCENIGAEQAERWGLVHERCAPGGLDTLVQQRASALAALPPHALRQQKHLLQHWQTASLTQAVQHSIDQFALAYTSGEPQALMGEFMARKLARSKSRT
ncbi:MAG TPA: enoyl-CoA hydratase [Rubrivivax sp.]|nr:enoyl-CoA hydratase [Rubrivivax sp.]